MSLKNILRSNGLHIAWSIALIATVGSLYLSEIMRYEPCKLCWYQRILMYPLVILLGIAAVRKDHKHIIYALPLAIIGACTSIYHILVQKTDWFQDGSIGCGLIPCDTDYLNWFGFVTIPMLALAAFLLIIIVLIGIHISTKK